MNRRAPPSLPPPPRTTKFIIGDLVEIQISKACCCKSVHRRFNGRRGFVQQVSIPYTAPGYPLNPTEYDITTIGAWFDDHDLIMVKPCPPEVFEVVKHFT